MQTCPHYDADGPVVDGVAFRPGKRHLLYHILPVARNGTWQRNLDMLIARLPLFNGKRTIAIATGEANDRITLRGNLPLDPPEAVREYLADHDCDFLELPNDPKLREVVTWGPLWATMADYQQTDDVVFYAHAKGVTRPANPGVTVHEWARMQYAANLDYWPLVAEMLAKHPVVGTFKKVGKGFQGSESSWHYSGTFFWSRVRDAYPKHSQIDQHWWGNEAWVGLHWSPEQAGCLFGEGTVPELDLYRARVTFDQLVPEFCEWGTRNASKRTQYVVDGDRMRMEDVRD